MVELAQEKKTKKYIVQSSTTTTKTCTHYPRAPEKRLSFIITTDNHFDELVEKIDKDQR